MRIKKPVMSGAACRLRSIRGARILAALCLWLAASSAYADLGLQRVIPLPGVRGQIGGLALDSAHQRLFIAVTGSNSLLAVDLERGTIVNRITGLNVPSDVAYLADDRVAVNCRGSGTVSFYDVAAFKLESSLIFGSGAGALHYDPASRELYFGYIRAGHNGVAVIGADGKLLMQLPVADNPVGLAVDAAARRLYVGFQDLNAITVFDLSGARQPATWRLGTGSAASHPLVLDGDSKRLFIGGRGGDEIAVLDTQTGKLLQTIAGPGDVAELYFDARNRELYVPGATGQLAIYKEDAAGLLHEIGSIPTRHGARSGVLDADTGRYYLALPATTARPAAIQVYLVIDRAADATQ